MFAQSMAKWKQKYSGLVVEFEHARQGWPERDGRGSTRAAGNRALQKVGWVVRLYFRQADFLARIAPEEFVINWLTPGRQAAFRTLEKRCHRVSRAGFNIRGGWALLRARHTGRNRCTLA